MNVNAGTTTLGRSPIPPWNDVVDAYLLGDKSPLFVTVRSWLLNRWQFKTKTDAEIVRQYGMDAEDFAQEFCIWLEEKQHPRRWRDEARSEPEIQAWLKEVFRTRLIDQYRKTQNERDGSDAGEEIDEIPMDPRPSIEAKELVEAIRASLNERQKRVLELYANYTQPEIAKILRVSLSTIEKDIGNIKSAATSVAESHIKERLTK